MSSLGLCKLVYSRCVHLIQLIYLTYELCVATKWSIIYQVLLCIGNGLSLCLCLGLRRLESKSINLMHYGRVIVIVIVLIYRRRNDQSSDVSKSST